MRHIKIHHLTRYRYAEAVTLLPHTLHLRPREGHDLRLESSRLGINLAFEIRWQRDVYGNSVAIVSFLEPGETRESGTVSLFAAADGTVALRMRDGTRKNAMPVDEFVALVPDVDSTVADRLAKRLTASLEQPYNIGRHSLFCAASEAQQIWARSGIEQRYKVLMAIGQELMQRSSEIGQTLSREEGKPMAEGAGEVYRAGQFFTYYAAETLRQLGQTADSVRDGIEIDKSNILLLGNTGTGKTIGCYTSPHVFRYNERIRVGGAEAGDEIIAMTMVRDALWLAGSVYVMLADDGWPDVVSVAK